MIFFSARQAEEWSKIPPFFAKRVSKRKFGEFEADPASAICLQIKNISPILSHRDLKSIGNPPKNRKISKILVLLSVPEVPYSPFSLIFTFKNRNLKIKKYFCINRKQECGSRTFHPLMKNVFRCSIGNSFFSDQSGWQSGRQRKNQAGKGKEKKQRKSTETKPGRTDGQKQNEKTPKIFNGGEIGKKSPKTTFQRGKNEKKGRFWGVFWKNEVKNHEIFNILPRPPLRKTQLSVKIQRKLFIDIFFFREPKKWKKKFIRITSKRKLPAAAATRSWRAAPNRNWKSTFAVHAIRSTRVVWSTSTPRDVSKNSRRRSRRAVMPVCRTRRKNKSLSCWRSDSFSEKLRLFLCTGLRMAVFFMERPKLGMNP